MLFQKLLAFPGSSRYDYLTKTIFIQRISKPRRKVILKRGVRAAEYLMFQGEPFAEEDYCKAIQADSRQWTAMSPPPLAANGIPPIPASSWSPGERGYIELRAVREVR